jgi:hypothetical protein
MYCCCMAQGLFRVFLPLLLLLLLLFLEIKNRLLCPERLPLCFQHPVHLLLMVV